MSKLDQLRDASSLQDLASILGFKPKAISYLLYVVPDSEKYSEFEIPKRTGGTRKIKAPRPELKNLQRRLSEELQDILHEINELKQINNAISHGFRRGHSIATNAVGHKRQRFVFNLDLEDFFESINFGRVRGYFIKNKNFELHPRVATVLAQIACHDNALPQGSPCSPVISNLVGHILDMRLAKLARNSGCRYSRYADDLTFSTRKKQFPISIAVMDDHSNWSPSETLRSRITECGFKINQSKTRMTFQDSRQDVTGLVVNAKVNTKPEYWRSVRAMTHWVVTTGEYYRTTPEGKPREGTIDELAGMLSFIDSIDHFNKRRTESKTELRKLNARERTYRTFLFYRHFAINPSPMLICEGKTDKIYLRAAMKKLKREFPHFVHEKGGKSVLQVNFFKYTKLTDRLMSMAGGTGDLKGFLECYKTEYARFQNVDSPRPIIVIMDHDQGVKGKNGIIGIVNQKSKKKVDDSTNFYYLGQNLYVVFLPKIGGKDTMLEDYFDASVLATKVAGKTLSLNKSFDGSLHYGKHIFATHVVEKQQDQINFDQFKPLLQRITDVLSAGKQA